MKLNLPTLLLLKPLVVSLLKNPLPSVMSMNVSYLLKTYGEVLTVHMDTKISIVLMSMEIANAQSLPNLVKILKTSSSMIS